MVPLTRKTAAFADLAVAIEADLARRRIDIGADLVDQILRNRIDSVAVVMRVTPRTALGYAPEDLPRIIGDTVEEARHRLLEPDTTQPPDRHLRIVEDL